ncbi:MAG TPA: GatB/YqeY domain-containing protein [Gammaproteobacteria bacterium]|nr:GatB/YqeY domain-containing protein [Gammaproteobacteria bacterium]
MSAGSIKHTIDEAMKAAMRAQEKQRLGAIRLITAAFKQKEVDERIAISDEIALQILDKMVKQRRDSIKQFEAAKRQDLIDQEQFELTVIQEFMPAALSADEVQGIIASAIKQTNATTAKDMGQVMAIIKPQLQGRADMGEVSKIIKSLLTG